VDRGQQVSSPDAAVALKLTLSLTLALALLPTFQLSGGRDFLILMSDVMQGQLHLHLIVYCLSRSEV
jgi:hypothetical protein